METTFLPPALCILGPTASGKTDLALLLSDRFPCEIISVDSAQVYRGMDIGTAKPTKELLQRYPHHLLDIRNVDENYSAAGFYHDAERLMIDITQRGRIPLLVGGTFLYFRAIEQGLNALPQANVEVRARITAQANRIGWPALHDQLVIVDPDAALRIDRYDGQRIQRALEVVELTGQPMSHFLAKSKVGLPYRWIKMALVPAERAVLYERINQRFDAMLAMGLVDEVRALFFDSDHYVPHPTQRIVGYRQILDYLNNTVGLEEAIEKGKTASRQYAKRQLTWLRREENIMKFPVEKKVKTDDILGFLGKNLEV